MRTFGFPFSLALLAIGSFILSAADAPLTGLVGANGALRISTDGRTLCEFTPGAFEPGWKFTQAGGVSGGTATESARAFRVKLGNGQIEGLCEARAEGGASFLSYSFTPASDVSVLSAHVNADFAVSQLAGAAWKADDKEGVFPTDFKSAHLHNGALKTLTLKLNAGTEFKLEFSEPTPVLLQDNPVVLDPHGPAVRQPDDTEEGRNEESRVQAQHHAVDISGRGPSRHHNFGP
jgi:hypothetical protein